MSSCGPFQLHHTPAPPPKSVTNVRHLPDPERRHRVSKIRARPRHRLRNQPAKLWHEETKAANEATILLLRLTAAARLHPNESPLIPHRLHFLVRAPQGLSACLNRSCPGPTHLQAEGIGCLQAPRDRCVYCNAITLPVHRCRACGQWALAGYENPDTGEMESGHFAEAAKRRYYLVSDSCGKSLSVVVVNPETGEYLGRGAGTRLFRAPCPEHGASCNDPSQCTRQACPNCATSWGASPDDTDEDDRDLQIQPLRGAERLALCAFGLRRLCLRRYTALSLLRRLCWKRPLTSCTKAQPRSGFHGFDGNSMR
jgi:hypothetical protein